MEQTITITTPGSAQAADLPPPRQRASAFDMVASTPWAIQPAMLETIGAIARRENTGVDAVEAKLGRPLQNSQSVTVRDGVAIVPVTGPVFRYANLFTSISGATSLDVLSTDFATALADPQIKAIVLNMDSPGGQANGIAEFAQMVRAATKPVVAYVDGMAASAAYWIASAASEIVLSKTGEVGSIGAVVGYDTSKQSGSSIEIVSSQSPKKRPDVTTAEGRSQIQTRIDALAQVFVEDVATYRAVSVDKVLADFGQGDMRMGADAVSIGMADRISTLEEVITGLSATSLPTKGGYMPNAKDEAVAQPLLTREFIAASHPDIAAAFRAEGATTERERIQSIEALFAPGQDALMTELKFDGKTTGPEAALRVNAAEKALAKNRAANFKADAPNPVVHTTAPDDAPSDPEQSPEEKAKAAWDGDKALRAEFGGNFASFMAYEKAAAAGTVRGLSRK